MVESSYGKVGVLAQVRAIDNRSFYQPRSNRILFGGETEGLIGTLPLPPNALTSTTWGFLEQCNAPRNTDIRALLPDGHVFCRLPSLLSRIAYFAEPYFAGDQSVFPAHFGIYFFVEYNLEIKVLELDTRTKSLSHHREMMISLLPLPLTTLLRNRKVFFPMSMQ